MYDTNNEPTDTENMGPYYVPWKKSSMDYFNRTRKTKVDSGYLKDSTIGNVGINNKKNN